MEYMVRAVKEAGFIPGKEISFALDVAASELYEDGMYYFPGQSFMRGEKVRKSAEEMIDYYEQLLEKFPIVSIEDGLCEEDWEGWVKMTQRLGDKVQLVGDDLFVTNTKRLQKGIEMGAGNAILIKVNQIGSLSEAMEQWRWRIRQDIVPLFLIAQEKVRTPLLLIWQLQREPDR